MSAEQPVVRVATVRDAAEVSAMIVETIRVSNAADYAPEVIERVSRNFAPDALVRMIAERHVLVASTPSRIVGTASLDGTEVRSVFVLPDHQGQRIGANLMAEVLQSARETRQVSVRVQSTVTALGFYARLGFVTVRDHWHGNERTVVMERPL